MSRQFLAAPGRFYIASSSDQWRSIAEMSWDCGVYRYRGHLVAPGVSFQILREGNREAAIYPSVRNAGPGVAHVLKGPDQHGHGFNWLVQSKADERGDVEVVLSCPKGTLLSLTWLRNGEAPPDIKDVDVAPVSDREGQLKLFQKNFGQWQLRGEIGRGKQRGAVFRAEGRDCQAAVKFPVSVREIQHLAALKGIPGVPELLDYSNGPGGGPFHVTPLLGESLEGLLRGREALGMGTRISWSATRALGKSLLAALQAMHGRGVIHCDLSPLNVLLGPRCCPFLIDFGQSHGLGTANFDKAEGTVEYNSIRAGYPGPRRPLDDLESLGWMMWRCVVGPLPWQDLPKEIDWSDRKARAGVYEQVSKMKERLLDEGFHVLGPKTAYCPDDLKAFLQQTRSEASRDSAEVSPVVYRDLAALLQSPDGQRPWEDFATSKPRSTFEARRGRLLWRLADAGASSQVEQSAVEEDARLLGTGCTEMRLGGIWAQLDPVWAPGLPQALCQRGGWALVADWAGQELWQLNDKGEYLPRARASAAAAGDVDSGRADCADALDSGQATTGPDDEEDEDEDEDRWLKAAASEAAHLYSRGKEAEREILQAA